MIYDFKQYFRYPLLPILFFSFCWRERAFPPPPTPLPFLRSYVWTNNKIDTKPDEQEKTLLNTCPWEIINDTQRKDEPASFLHSLDKETVSL